jgi:hypothetical protein
VVTGSRSWKLGDTNDEEMHAPHEADGEGDVAAAVEEAVAE